MIEQEVQAVLTAYQNETGTPYARDAFGDTTHPQDLPDSYIVWLPVAAPGTAYAGKTRAETWRIQVTYYTKAPQAADAVMRNIETRFESAGFCLVGSIGDDSFDTGHYSRRRDFRIRIKRRDFNG